MTSRISRLEQSVCRTPAPASAGRRRTPRPARTADRRTHAFDDGADIAVHVSADAAVAPAAEAPASAAVGSVLTTTPVAGGPAPAGAAPSAVGDLGGPATSDAGGSGPAEATLAAGSAGTAGEADDLGAAQSVEPEVEKIDDWIVTAPAPRAPEDEAAFAQDIRAILSHARSGPQPVRAPLPEVPEAPREAPPAAPQWGVGAAVGHDVFERMTAANAPSRFDQGPVSLSVDFSRLDGALAAEEHTAPSAEPAPAAPAATPSAPTAAVAEAPAEPAPSAPASGPPEQSERVASDDVFAVTTDAPLVPQVAGMSCHAAACASVVAWRDEVAPDPAAIAAGEGYWEQFAEGRTATCPDVLEAFGLQVASAGEAPTGRALCALIDENGPLFVATQPPGEHAVVIAGARSDGSATTVDVVDPWAEGMTTFAAPTTGSRASLAWDQIATRIGGAVGAQLLIARLRKG
ncbi:papain-like cysteine protease family protein [Microbacterium fluvii]|uniref:Papain-like cysteine protease family protein n=1 Tax=Microbacterium fluvii TaxID=415215 RepID=A0ABW2HE74_9MICO|nr:papain-like cysteine protease family protein [Microbacterium fluvii]MCU4673182.1 hypothetical protein [Microbacterium fluvii]